MKRTSFVVFILVCAVSSVVYAGGPFNVESVERLGIAQQWMSRTLEGDEASVPTLTWAYDEGPLSSSVSNETAVGWVRAAMDRWADTTYKGVATVNVRHLELGRLSEDVATIEQLDAIFENNPDYVGALVIFDADGAMLQELGFNTDPNAGKIVALTALLNTDESGQKITQGIIILDGTFLDYISGLANKTEIFKAALVHEVGHLYNLDHTQINFTEIRACKLGEMCSYGGNVATMFPELVTYRQYIPITDDKITISWIYPSEEFISSFCTVVGEVQDSAGNPLQGVNVYARSATGTMDALVDRRSMVSGVMYPACTADGHYYLYGLAPNKDYIIEYEPLSEQYSAESGFEPLSGIAGKPLPPQGFSPGVISRGDDTTVRCGEGGTVITMDTVQLDVSNPCAELAPIGGSPELGMGESGSASSSKCSLVKGQPGDSDMSPVYMFGAALIVVTVARRCRRSRVCRF